MGRFSFLPRRRRGVAASSSLLLARMLGPRMMEEVVRTTPDRRLLFSAAAHLAGVPEEALVATIARRLGFQYHPKPYPFDFRAGGISPVSFRKAAAIPLSADRVVHEISCVDPYYLADLPSVTPKTAIFLTPWQRIADALQASDALPLTLPPQLEGVIVAVVKECTRWGATAVTISANESFCQYELTGAEHRRIGGTIHPSVGSDLIRLLNNADAPPAINVEGRRLPLRREGISRWRITLESGATPLRVKCEVPPQEVPTGETHQRGSLLIVEDDPVFLEVVRRFFMRRGLRVITVPDGEAALALLQQGATSPDAIVCDVHMPKMTGPEFVLALRIIDQLPEIPVLMLTSDRLPETHLRAVESGARLLLDKGSDPRVLAAHIEQFLPREARAL